MGYMELWVRLFTSLVLLVSIPQNGLVYRVLVLMTSLAVSAPAP